MLVFNSHATDQDIVSEVLRRSQAFTVDNFPLVDITRIANFGLDWYYQIAFLHGMGWKFDDFNQSSPPIDTQNIVSGTNRYKLSDFTETVTGAIRVEILNADGKGLSLDVDTMEELDRGSRANESGRVGWLNKDTFQEKYINADSGTPTSYIIYGDYIYLDKKPNYSEANGLLIYFNRPAVYFASTDTTKKPGITDLHVEHLCDYISLRWKLDNDLISRNEWVNSVEMMKEDIAEYFGRIRSQNKRKRLSVGIQSANDCR